MALRPFYHPVDAQQRPRNIEDRTDVGLYLTEGNEDESVLLKVLPLDGKPLNHLG